MASEQRNVDFVLEQMSGAGDVSARKMFGEYAIYCGGKLVALFCDDQLFMKPTAAGRALVGEAKEASPYPGAKPYFLITGDLCEDGDWLSELVRATARELPMPKPKAPRKSAKATQKVAKSPRKVPKSKAKIAIKTTRAKPAKTARAKPAPPATATKRVAKKPARRS